MLVDPSSARGGDNASAVLNGAEGIVSHREVAVADIILFVSDGTENLTDLCQALMTSDCASGQGVGVLVQEPQVIDAAFVDLYPEMLSDWEDAAVMANNHWQHKADQILAEDDNSVVDAFVEDTALGFWRQQPP